jgi:hypothetical protein
VQNISGVSPDCLYCNYNYLLVATNDDKYIYDYTNLILNQKDEKEKSNKFLRKGKITLEGQKKNLLYFQTDLNNYYIVYQIEGKNFSTLHIYYPVFDLE